uniref:Vitelline membrane outer layer protein 1-like n=1 Tax=Sinocyclocheilus grahami TaxID=75366 RepID=A0A672S7X9_SINGR
MHHLISMMFSLLVITGLQVSVESAGKRSERSVNRHYRLELTVPHGGRWGSWGPREMCPAGTYAAGFSLKAPYAQKGDITALNGIRLHCIDLDELIFLKIMIGLINKTLYFFFSWGRWTDIKWCPSGFLNAFLLLVEKPQGAGDDTAANTIAFTCSGGSLLQGDGTNWGDWGKWSHTCVGKAICGIQSRIEEPQGEGDDTALNDVRMFCCD